MCESSITKEMNQPLLHVMIPVYGNSPYLEETLNSVVKNLPATFPITVVEDLSKQSNNQEVVKRFERIQYVQNEERLGIAKNFDKCIKLSTGMFTQIIGSDDIFIREAITDVNIDLLMDPELSIIINDVEVINKNGKRTLTLTDSIKHIIKPKLQRTLTEKQFLRSVSIGDWAYFPSIYWKTENTKKIGFSDKFHTAMDLAIFYDICKTKSKILIGQEKVIKYRRHKNSASVKYSYSQDRYIEELECQIKAYDIAKTNNWKMEIFLSQLSLTIRLHMIFKAIIMLGTNYSLSKQICLLAIKKLPK
jgi:glycosyltransferase involved in cell wall biosynthesis